MREQGHILQIEENNIRDKRKQWTSDLQRSLIWMLRVIAQMALDEEQNCGGVS